MKKNLIYFLVLMLVVMVPAAAFASTVPVRLQGQDRYETAISISKTGWPDGSNHAVLAYGENYPDALCAAPLAQLLDAPILLTDKNELDPRTYAELQRLKTNDVIIVGGTGVISSNVENYLKSRNINCTRLAGQDRYETSIKIADYLWSHILVSPKVFVVNGEDFPDAISVSSIAAQNYMPIILSYPGSNSFDKYIKDFADSYHVTKAYIVGGSDLVRSAVDGIFPQSQRIYGDDKYWRNTAVIRTFLSDPDYKPLNFSTVFVATGENFPDALAGSVLASRMNSPIFLVGKSLPGAARDLLMSKLLPDSSIKVLGGSGAVSDPVLDDIVSLIPGTSGGFEVIDIE